MKNVLILSRLILFIYLGLVVLGPSYSKDFLIAMSGAFAIIGISMISEKLGKDEAIQQPTT